MHHRESRLGGHVDTMDVAIVRQGKESLAVAHPGEGLVVIDLNRKVDDEAAIRTVVDPNRLAPKRRSGDESSVGRKLDRNHPVGMFEGAEQSLASRERPDAGSAVIRSGRDFGRIW